MRRHEESGSRRTLRRGGPVAVAAGVSVVLSGCGEEFTRGYMPHPVTEVGPDVIHFWNGTWIAALAIGILVWALILWCVFAYRKKDETYVPVQTRYHIPLEILYTIVPILMVAAMFGNTVKLKNEMLRLDDNPDVVINVAGKKWSWDFNYVNENVYDAGTQAYDLNRGEQGLTDTLPTLYLPVDSRVEFVLTSRDVIHSFWVPQFLQKLDMVPGRVNNFQVTTTEEGTFQGKCAELCGAYHSEMLFQVKVVSQEEYDKHIQALKDAGKTGQLGLDKNMYKLEPGQERKLTNMTQGSGN